MNAIPHNPFELRGKRVLVTGASSGIGRAIAIASAEAGATLVLSGRDDARLRETLDLLDGEGHRAVAADLTDPQQLAALVEQTGQIDGVVHGAGVDGVMPVRMLRKSFLDTVAATNFQAPILLTQQLLYKKNLRDGGSIVFLSSIAAHTGTVGVGPYSSSKSALEGIMRCLALEVAKRAIRVNALAPGLVNTPLINKDHAWLEEKSAMYPWGIGDPNDVAYAAVYFLCDGSRKVTGTSFHLDGGIAWT